MTKYSLLHHPKTQKLDRIGAPWGRFEIFDPFCRKPSNKREWGHFGENFLSKKKSHYAEKTERGPFSVARYCMLRGKQEKNLLGSVSWANGYNLKFRRTFGRTILIISGVSKKCHKAKITSEL